MRYHQVNQGKERKGQRGYLKNNGWKFPQIGEGHESTNPKS